MKEVGIAIRMEEEGGGGLKTEEKKNGLYKRGS